MWTTLDGLSPTPDQVYDLQKVYFLVTAIVYFVLVWDYLANLHNEYRLFYKESRNSFAPRHLLTLNNAFLASRYITLAWCTFVVICYGLVEQHPHICAWAKYFPYGYSTAMLFAHFVMVLRIYTVYERKRQILYILLGLAAVDYAIQMAANHAATAVYLHSDSPQIGICYLQPTSMVYALVFISPTIFHHLILVMTLYKSIKHLRATRAGGIRSIMQVVQRDQILFVLAICLINFSNLVLVLQRSSWPYKLINQLPAAAFTQIFLSRIIFSLKSAQIRLASTNVTPDISILPLSPTSPRTFTPGNMEEGNDSTLWSSSSRSQNTFTPDTSGKGGSSVNLLTLSHQTSYGFNAPPRDSSSKVTLYKSVLAKQQEEAKIGSTFNLDFDPRGRRKLRKGEARGPLHMTKSNTNNKSTHLPEESYTRDLHRSQSAPSAVATSPDTAMGLAIYERQQVPDHDESAMASMASLSPTSPTFSLTPLIVGGGVQNSHGNSTAPANLQGESPDVATKDFGSMELSRNAGLSSSSSMEMQKFSSAASPMSRLPLTGTSRTSHQALSLQEEDEAEADYEPTRCSFESRTGTIDEQQRTMDWEPPSAWGSTGSHRGSPIPFSDRRLSNSVARNSLLPLVRELTPTRARRASNNANNGSSPSRRLSAGSGTANPTSSSPHRTSACYASVFSFENEEAVDEEDDDVELVFARPSVSPLDTPTQTR